MVVNPVVLGWGIGWVVAVAVYKREAVSTAMYGSSRGRNLVLQRAGRAFPFPSAIPKVG